MSITFDPKASQISAMRVGRFAPPMGEKALSDVCKPEDQLNISQAGQEAAARAEGETGFDEMAEQLEARLSSMTKESLVAMAREQLGEPKQLEINWNAQ